MIFLNKRRVFQAFGNGDAEKGKALFLAIAKRLAEARKKHPVYAEGPYNALGVIGAEYRELENAVINESVERQADEALDVIATAIRFVNNEHDGYAE